MSKKNLILGVMALIACIGAYLLAGSPDERDRSTGKIDPHILSAETIAAPDEPPTKEERAGRFAYWETLTGGAEFPERREVEDEDNGFFEWKKMADLHGDFMKNYSNEELDTIREMALGKEPWDQEIVDHVLQDAEGIFREFEKVLAKPDFQFPDITQPTIDDQNLGWAHKFLSRLKVTEAENLRRAGDLRGATNSTLGYLEMVDRIRIADGGFTEELIGIHQSRDAQSAIKRILNTEGATLEPDVLNAIAEQLSSETPPQEVTKALFSRYHQGMLWWLGRHIEADVPPALRMGGMTGPDGTEWDAEQVQEAFDRADLGRLFSTLDSKWSTVVETSESLARVEYFPQFSGDENSTLESMTPRQLGEFLGEEIVPILGRIGAQAVEGSLERRLMQTWVATERARLDGIEVTSPEVLVPRYLEAIPENPLTGEPLSFDGTFFGIGFGETEMRF